MLRQNQSCQVCHNQSAAFYCGANVCEACKKFFIRSWKSSKEENNYVCLQENRCIINKETRKRCASCRYNLCLELNMYLPGGSSLLGEISRIPCRVCGTPSSGFHFGAITCDGCKGFFRRSQNKKFEKLKCNENDSCIISSGMRGVCKSCKLKKCLSVGMQVEKCKIGRRPNIVKHTTKLEVQKIINKSLSEGKSKDFGCEKHSIVNETSRPSSETIDTNIGEDQSLLIDEDYENSSDACLKDPDVSSSYARDFESNESISHDAELNLREEVVEQQPSLLDDYRFSRSKNIPRHSKSSARWLTASTVDDLCKSNSSEILAEYACHITPVVHSPDSEMEDSIDEMAQNFEQSPDQLDNWSSDNHLHRTIFKHPNDVVVSSHHNTTNVNNNATYNNNNATYNNNNGTYIIDNEEAGKLLRKYSLSSALEKPSYQEMISLMKHSFNYLLPILSRPPNSSAITENSPIDEMWKLQMQQFERCAHSILAFARRIPGQIEGFKKLPMSAQIELIQKSLYPVVVCVLSIHYDPRDNSFSYFSFTQSEMKTILNTFHVCRPLTQTFINIGKKIKAIDMDNVEIAFLCAVYLLDFGGRYEYKELLIDTLEFYVKGKHGLHTERHHHILMILRTMSDINQIHSKMIINLLKDPKFSSLSMTQLYEEAFFTNESISQVTWI